MRHRVPPPTPHLRTHWTRAYTVLEFHGEIDIAAAVQMIPHLDAATAEPRPRIIIDLTPTEFFDGSGLHLLCRTRRQAEERDGHLLLVCPHPLTLRILHTVHLADVFHPARTLQEVLGRPTPAHGPDPGPDSPPPTEGTTDAIS
ncbi:STAS domain-containing protein [Streptomyces sp. WM6378]|uniref:STAS domain-containing protein n=1 Tax=Streptomyces sp. WM6378 TaxID=1415557 RepID=UPI0006AF7F8F|nr:STAS domain-containing protein [Streptomyces sp. WM6378]KOU36246.1 hypothetical protein ADK54_34565 [Streptomyces sp. WM6378]